MSKRGNYGRWTEQEMSMAIGAYRAGEAGSNECARRYNISKSTLLRHLRATAVETLFTEQEKVADGSAESTNQAISIENSTAVENSSNSRSSVTKTPINTDKVPGEITPDELNQSLNELAPVLGTSKTIQQRQTKTTASAVILTSTPYKETLEEKQRQTDKGNVIKNKKRKANEESKHKKEKEQQQKYPQERETKHTQNTQNKRTRREKPLLDKATVNFL
ncbi:hypothetical protein JTB14_000887 [Gonioctena quinquepunctata]|nr:hypothetical protein JTB14_000887 [Gonioctena quinquepunctata]